MTDFSFPIPENLFAAEDAADTLSCMDAAVVVHGACLHGTPIQAFSTAVVFLESCRPCEALLLAEGYHVHHSLGLAA